MFFRDLTLFLDAFKGFEGDVYDLADEVRKSWCGDVSALEVGDGLDSITLYDYPIYGPTNALSEFCGQHGVDLQSEWGGQVNFDKVARDAMMSVW